MRPVFKIILLCLLFILAGFSSGFGEENWHRLVTGDISLFCQKQDFRQGEMILEEIRSTLPDIMNDLQLSISGEIKIVLAPDDEKFHAMTGGAIPEWGVGAADKQNRLIFLKSPRYAGTQQNIKQVLIHELTHVLVGMQLNHKPLPRWFDEGLAMWTSKDTRLWDQIRFSRAMLTGNEIPLSEIDYVLSFRKDKAALAYWQSRSAVDYLAAQYGKSTLQMLLDAEQDTVQWNQWFQTITGMTVLAFENEWMVAQKQKYGWTIFIDHRLLISLLFAGLFITAYSYKRFQTRKKLRLWEEDEKALEDI